VTQKAGNVTISESKENCFREKSELMFFSSQDNRRVTFQLETRRASSDDRGDGAFRSACGADAATPAAAAKRSGRAADSPARRRADRRPRDAAAARRTAIRGQDAEQMLNHG